MSARLEIRRWLQVYRAVYCVAQSGDGQYVALGTETGVVVLNLGGQRMAVYPADGRELPVHQVRAPLDFTRLLLATRLGDVIAFDLEPSAGRFDLNPRALHYTPNDLYTLDFSATVERVALGHYSFALTMLNLDGDEVWRQQDAGEAARSSMWSVSLTPDGGVLYAGSAGSGTNWLLALDAGSGAPLYRRECAAPVVAVAALADNAGVVTLAQGEYDTAHLTAYSANLADVLWEQDLDGPATALAADLIEPLVAVGAGYEGVVSLVDATTGAMLASEPLRAMVNGLSLARGRFIAAATQDSSVALLHYLP